MVIWTILDHFGPVHFPTVPRPLSKNGFFADFYFWAAGFFRGFSRWIFSQFCVERVPRKMLQEDPRPNPPKFIRQKSPIHFCRGAVRCAILVRSVLKPSNKSGREGGGGLICNHEVHQEAIAKPMVKSPCNILSTALLLNEVSEKKSRNLKRSFRNFLRNLLRNSPRKLSCFPGR